MTGYSMADFMLGVPRQVTTAADQISGTGGRLAERVLRQRRVAGDVEDDAEPRAPLRAEHAGPDLLGLRHRARRDPDEDHPSATTLPVAGLQVPRAEHDGLRAADRGHLPPDREDDPARRLGHLLQPEPDEHVHVPDQQPAAGRADHLQQRSEQPDALLQQPDRRRRARRPAEHDHAQPRSAERVEEPVELRPPAGAVPVDGGRASSTSASRTKNLDRSYYPNTPAARARRHRPAAAEPAVPGASASSRTT